MVPSFNIYNMKKDPEIFDDDLDLENLLKPRAEFRVSPAFKQKVMAEAKVIPIRSRRRWMPLAISSAAAIAMLVILTAVYFHSSVSPTSQQHTTAAIEKKLPAPGESLNKEDQTLLIAEAAPVINKEKASQKRTKRKKPATKAVSATTDITNPSVQESKPQPVSEGEMPMISREKPQEPNEVRTRIIETRRNAEIAYIERMRDVIEANQAYIKQLMAEANVESM